MGSRKVFSTTKGNVIMNIVQDLTGRLQKRRILGALLILGSLSISAAFLTGLFLSDSLWIQLGAGMLSLNIALVFFLQRGWFKKPSEAVITRFLDRNYPFLEESSSLFTRPPKTVFENWQLEKIRESVEQNRDQIRLPNRILKRAIILSVGILFFTALTGIIIPKSSLNRSADISFDSSEDAVPVASEETLPAIQNVEVSINPPGYTNLPQRSAGHENLSVPEASLLKWKVITNHTADSVWIQFGNQSSLVLNQNQQSFEGEMAIGNNQIYQIGISSPDTTIFTDYRSVSVISDSPPQFLINSPGEQRSIITEQNRNVYLDVQIMDDYNITDASVQVTLARGSGENVRFRERTIDFDEITGINHSQARGTLTLNADSLEMQPGDELYFFVTATDNRPEPQTGRSETYFVTYQDTTEAEAASFGAIAVDLMPEYFRSQRQIIIDTEKLLEEKPEISEREFEERSNTIGQNQALLRLRYGEYLGMEDESGEEIFPEAPHEHEGENHDHSAEDINEHGLERSQSESAANIPEELMHDHGSAEMNTLFADSPRALLRESLANMWDAEQYLRTHRPETALAYEYRALEMLKKAQEANRQYVRKVGYELSPIPVDESRLTGTYDNFSNPGEAFTADFEQSPLTKLELMIREETMDNPDNIEQATEWTEQASISDADRLYILNRLRRISTEGFTDEMKTNLLNRITGIKKIREYDPAPSHRPVLGSLPENS